MFREGCFGEGKSGVQCGAFYLTRFSDVFLHADAQRRADEIIESDVEDDAVDSASERSRVSQGAVFCICCVVWPVDSA